MRLTQMDPVVAAFVVIPLLLVSLLAWGTAAAWRRSGASPAAAARTTLFIVLAAAVWMAATWAIASEGVLRRWDQRPPPALLLVAAIVGLSCLLAFSAFGGRLARFLPLWALVAVQSFRLPLELAMHEMYERGVMPVQMSYSGRNFDILTGATAIVVALLARAGIGGRTLVAAWNALGLALLVNIVAVALLSTPVFRYFGDDRLNTWVADPPFVWLPAVMVLAAFAGHLLIARALLIRAAPEPPRPGE